MADLTNSQKKELAYVLYAKENLTQKEIAEKVGVSTVTVCKWVKKGKWDELRTAITMTNDRQIADLRGHIAEINKEIAKRPEGKRIATPAEADMITKHAKAIERLEGERTSLKDIVGVGILFTQFIRHMDIEKAKDFTVLWDAFVEDYMEKNL
ncbi:DUF1804 family protein [Parabacteroides sp. OttesenSCG-928-B22]|nr:DUF1804 family protein [Parabacteroides sp. OttesenSCG-928-B22]